MSFLEQLGQITVIGLALVVIAGWGRLGGERKTLVRWSSAAIAAVGAFWAVTRALGT